MVETNLKVEILQIRSSAVRKSHLRYPISNIGIIILCLKKVLKGLHYCKYSKDIFI